MDKKVLILVDSSTTLTPEIAKKNDIEILPLSIYRDDGESYIYESLKMSNDQFLQMSESGHKFKTGCTPVGIIEEIIKNGLNKYDFIIALTISKKWSSQYQHIQALAEKDEYKNKICVIDTQEWGFTTEYMALELRKRIDSDIYTLDEIIDYANKFQSQVVSFFLCRSLDGLVNSGRIPKVVARLLKFAKIYPILRVENGENHLEAIIKNVADSTNKIIKSIYKFYDNKLNQNDIVKIAIITACNNDDYIKELKNDIIKTFGLSDDSIVIRPTPSIFINIVSRNAIGVCVITNKQNRT